MTQLQVKVNTEQVTTMQAWYGRMLEASGAPLPMESWARDMMEGLKGLGVTRPEQIREGSVAALSKKLNVAVDQLLASTRRCPFAMGLPKLEG